MGMAQHDLTPTIDKTCQFCIAHRPLEIFITGLSPKNFPGCHKARFGHSGAAPVVLLPAIFQEAAQSWDLQPQEQHRSMAPKGRLKRCRAHPHNMKWIFDRRGTHEIFVAS